MQFRTAFKAILAKKRVSYARLGEALGANGGRAVSGPAVSSMIRKGNPSLDALRPYLDVLGYDVVLVPKGSAALLPEGSYVIDGADPGEES